MVTDQTPTRPRGEKLLPAQRQSFILDVLVEQRAATLHQLSDRLGASTSTVRRDLDELASQGFVVRTHGGATLGNSLHGRVSAEKDDEPDVPSGELRAIKAAIGMAAAARIEEGHSVIFDASSTVMEAARVIVGAGIHITAVTNSIKLAGILSRSEAVRLIVPGGSRRNGTFTLAGEPGDSFLRRLHVDVALIGAQSSSSGRLTDSRVEGASNKRLLMDAAKTKLLLIDSWKFGGPGFCDVAPLTEFDEVITDTGLSLEERRELERQGVFLHVSAAAGGKGSEAARPGQDDDKREAPVEM